MWILGLKGLKIIPPIWFYISKDQDESFKNTASEMNS